MKYAIYRQIRYQTGFEFPNQKNPDILSVFIWKIAPYDDGMAAGNAEFSQVKLSP
jgi:hypothetical protein